MKLLASRIERQFQQNLQQHALANELRVNVQRLKMCFLGSSLPMPTAEVMAAWNDLPNATVDTLPMFMKTGLLSLRTPPPTPTGLVFDTDDTASDDSSLKSFPNGEMLLADDVCSPTLDAVALQDLEHSIASDSPPVSRCSGPDGSLDRQSNEGESAHSTRSPSSDESFSSNSQPSLKPVGSHTMISQWLLDYRARGTDSFTDSLIAFGVVSQGTAPLASRIARAVVRKVTITSDTEGKSLKSAIRSAALTAFKKAWKLNDTTDAKAVSPTPHDINVASFMGSLFDAGISSAKDVHLCLSLLLEGEKRFDRLCAMQALLAQANDKLCKQRYLPALMEFQHKIASRDGETGEYLWVTASRSKRIIIDILATIERWLASQALRRDVSRTTPGHRTIHARAAGPRLRSSPVMAAPLIACV